MGIEEPECPCREGFTLLQIDPLELQPGDCFVTHSGHVIWQRPIKRVLVEQTAFPCVTVWTEGVRQEDGHVFSDEHPEIVIARRVVTP